MKSTPDQVGRTLAAVAGVGVAAHFASWAVKRGAEQAKESHAGASPDSKKD
jgi:hypothetical protein